MGALGSASLCGVVPLPIKACRVYCFLHQAACHVIFFIVRLMLIRQGAARSSSNDRRLACTLAAAAGALNTAAFQAVGFFSANMTGNVSSLSDHAALGQWLLGAFYLTIVLALLGRAAVSQLLLSPARGRTVPSHFSFP